MGDLGLVRTAVAVAVLPLAPASSGRRSWRSRSVPATKPRKAAKGAQARGGSRCGSRGVSLGPRTEGSGRGRGRGGAAPRAGAAAAHVAGAAKGRRLGGRGRAAVEAPLSHTAPSSALLRAALLLLACRAGRRASLLLPPAAPAAGCDRCDRSLRLRPGAGPAGAIGGSRTRHLRSKRRRSLSKRHGGSKEVWPRGFVAAPLLAVSVHAP